MGRFKNRKVYNLKWEGKWYNFSVYKYEYKDTLVVVHGPMKNANGRKTNIVGKFAIESDGTVRAVERDNFHARGYKDNDSSTWIDYMTLFELYERKVTRRISS